jgi:hypothetical protein
MRQQTILREAAALRHRFATSPLHLQILPEQ